MLGRSSAIASLSILISTGHCSAHRAVARDAPVLIRGRRIDKPGVVGFGGSQPALVDPQFAPGATPTGADGIREWPGATWIKAPGCYAWQIDGTTFSSVVVFRARFAGA
jgi:hypothetical protein